MIRVWVSLGKNVLIFLKGILIFLKNVYEVPKSISGRGNVSNHFLKILEEIYRS